VSCLKTAEPIEVPFGIWTQVGPRDYVLGRLLTGATWRILLNRPRAAAMRPVVKLFWPLVIVFIITKAAKPARTEN